MEIFSRKPNILFLSGISTKDVITIEDQIINKYCTTAQECKYIYYEKDAIIISDNKRCLNCTRIITDEAQSAFIPTFVKETIHNTIEFGKYGQTCSFNCAVTEIISSTNDGSTERDKFLNNLKILFYLKNGYHISNIKPAPNKNVLKEYGGEWSEDQFMAEMNKLNNYTKFVISNITEQKSSNVFTNISNMLQKNNTPKIIDTTGKNKITFNNLGTMQSNKRTVRSMYTDKIVCSPDGIDIQQFHIDNLMIPTKSVIRTNNLIINEFFI
jgi:hypothetical protein